MKRAIIFDFGGVLMRTMDYSPRHTWDNRLGLARGSVEAAVHNSTSWVEAQLGQITLEQYWADVAGQLGISHQWARQLSVDFYSGDQLDRDLIGLIRRLRQNGHPVAMLSNNTADMRQTLEKEQVLDLFDPLVISAEIGVMKPAAEAYQIVLKAMDRPAQEAVFVDDNPANVEGARALGMAGIRYTAGMDLAAALGDFLSAEIPEIG